MRAIQHLQLAVIFVVASLFSSPIVAQGLVGQEAKLLDLTRGSWAYFRDYNGRQLIYFTHLEVYRCGIARAQYSLNNDSLDKEWKLQPCDLKKPNEITTDKVYISLPLKTANSIAVRLTFKDGSLSPLVRIGSDNQLIR